MTTKPTIGTFAPWFGGKRELAPVIVDMLGPHRAYWEPFAGSMAVLMAKPPCAMETVCDLHGDIINLARVLRDPVYCKPFEESMRTVLCAEAELELAKYEIKTGRLEPTDKPDLRRAVAYFTLSWLGRCGHSGTTEGDAGRGFGVRFTAGGGSHATRFASAIESIGAWSERLRKVTILKTCGIERISKIEDADGVAIYCDPPYFDAGRAYTHAFAERASDGFAYEDDHDRLAEALNRFDHSKIVVSYYPHPRIDELYPDSRWQRVEVTVEKKTAKASDRGSRGEDAPKATELMLVSRRA